MTIIMYSVDVYVTRQTLERYSNKPQIWILDILYRKTTRITIWSWNLFHNKGEAISISWNLLKRILIFKGLTRTWNYWIFRILVSVHSSIWKKIKKLIVWNKKVQYLVKHCALPPKNENSALKKVSKF